jgi:hypothetical protein
LVGLSLLTNPPPVLADTIGEPLDNNPSGPAPTNTYVIPGLGRDRQRGEGSFMQYGTSSTGTPITSSTAGDFASGKTESPTLIEFNKGDEKHGNQYFSINYVDGNDFVDFKNANDANSFNKNPNAPYWNPGNVKSKMTVNAQGTPQLASDQSYNNGFLQITGNVPIHAQIGKAKTSVDSIMSGNWGVMVRVRVPKGIDAKSLGGAIAWDKSYFYLTLDATETSISLPKPFDFIKFPITFKDFNFPLQFDHHVYLDKNDPQTFYLKVKGIPFNINDSSDHNSAQMQLQKGSADYLDYLHNQYFTDNTMKNLDNLKSQNTVGSDPNVQPDFPTNGNGQKATWDPYYGLLNQYVFLPIKEWPGGELAYKFVTSFVALGSPESPVYLLGNTGRTLALLNAADGMGSDNRQMDGTGIWNWFKSWAIQPIINNIASYFVTGGFDGSAHINFSFDMSKFSGSSTLKLQSLTSQRLFASPYADGLFNKGDTTGKNPNNPSQAADDKDNPNRRTFDINLYGSNQLVDPYNVLGNADRNDGSKNAPILQHFKAGKTPIDYALVKESEKNNGTQFPVYTNFSSWTAAAVPFDNSTVQNDTLNSSGDPLGSDMRSRTATPDARNNGVLMNDGDGTATGNLIKKPYNKNTEGDYQPVYQDTSEALQYAGGIEPNRYLRVYSLYDYSAKTPTTLTTPKRIDNDSTVNSNLQAFATTSTNGDLNSATNVAKGYTGGVTTAFENNKWVYTGTYNGIPILPATLGLKQSLSPTVNQSGSQWIVVPKSQITNGNFYKMMPWGTYSDRLGAGLRTEGLNVGIKKILDPDAGMYWKTDIKLSADVVEPTTNPINLAVNATDKMQSQVWASLSDPNEGMFPNIGKRSQDVNTYFTLSQDYPLYNAYIQVYRNTTLTINTPDRATTPNSSFLKKGTMFYFENHDDRADYSQAHQRFIIFVTDQDQNFQITKKFDGNNPNDYWITKNGDKANITATVKNTGKTTNTNRTFTIVIPKVAGTTLSTPTVPGATVTTNTDANISLGDAGQAYTVTFPAGSSIPPNGTFTYHYAYTVNNVTAVPNDSDLQDLLLDQNLAVLGKSNTIQLHKVTNPYFTQVPDLDFATHNLPSTTQTYANVNKNTAFNIQDNRATPGNWVLFGQLGAFTNGTDQQKGFQINYGIPNGEVLPSRLNPANSSYDPRLDPTNPSFDADYAPGAWTNAERAYLNHQADTMTADNRMTELYRFVSTLQPGDMGVSHTLDYNDGNTVKLTVPGAAATSLHSGRYTATVTYTLNSNSTTIN